MWVEEYECVNVSDHRSYAAYNAYFVNGDDALVIDCYQEPCVSVGIVSVKGFVFQRR